MGFDAAPGGCGFLPRAQFVGGGVQLGFQSIVPVRNDPRGVGWLGRPMATPYVRVTFPFSTTLSVRAERLTTSCIGGAGASESRTSVARMTTGTIANPNNSTLDRGPRVSPNRFNASITTVHRHPN